MVSHVSDARWHEIPSPNGRISRLENALSAISYQITQLNLLVAQHREKIQQLELENEQLRNEVRFGV